MDRMDKVALIDLWESVENLRSANKVGKTCKSMWLVYEPEYLLAFKIAML